MSRYMVGVCLRNLRVEYMEFRLDRLWDLLCPSVGLTGVWLFCYYCATYHGYGYVLPAWGTSDDILTLLPYTAILAYCCHPNLATL